MYLQGKNKTKKLNNYENRLDKLLEKRKQKRNDL